MADAKVTIRLGTTADTRGLNDLSDGMKKAASTQKDFIDGGVKAVGALTAKFNNDLTGAISGSFSVLREVVRGGLWGGVAAAASLAINKIVEKWEAAKKAAKEYSDLLRKDMVSAAERVAAAFKGTASALEKERKATASLLAQQNAAIESRAGHAAADATTAELTGKGGPLAKAEADRARGLAAATAKVEKAAAAEEAALKNVETAAAAHANAEDALASATKVREEFEQRNAKLMYERERLQKSLAEVEGDYSKAGLSFYQATKLAKGYRLALAKFEEEHKDELESLSKITKVEADAKAALAAAESSLAEAQRSAAQAGDAKSLAEQGLMNDEMRLGDAVRAAKDAEDKLIKEKEERAKAEAKAKQAANEKAEADKAAAADLSAALRLEQDAADKATAAAQKADEKIMRLDRRIKAAENDIARQSAGMAADARHTNGIFGPYQYHTDENGQIDNAIDRDRALRFGARAARDAQRAERRNDAQRKRAQNISDRMRRGGYVTDAEKKFLDNWNDFEAQRNNGKKLRDEREKLVQDREKNIQEANQHLANIEKEMKDFIERNTVK